MSEWFAAVSIEFARVFVKKSRRPAGFFSKPTRRLGMRNIHANTKVMIIVLLVRIGISEFSHFMDKRLSRNGLFYKAGY